MFFISSSFCVQTCACCVMLKELDTKYRQETLEIGPDHLLAEVSGQGTEKEVEHASLLDV